MTTAEHEREHAHEHSREDTHHDAHGLAHVHSGTHTHGVPAQHTGDALRVVLLSSLVLAVVAGLELAAAAISNSAGVLADGLHNVGDVFTTLALATAFILSRRAPTRRFPYGYHRGEDLAGLVVLLLIVASAVASGVTSVEHLVHPPTLSNPSIALAVAGVGFLGNELVAEYKIVSGRRMGSVALVADGQHSRLDGLASLGAALGVLGAMLGAPVLDPVAGLAVTAVIVAVAWETARNVTGRLLDEADASLLDTIVTIAAATPGILAVNDVRARWTGRRVLAEVTLELSPEETLARAHAVGEEVRHRLYHEIQPLAEVIVHLDPAGDHLAHEAVSHHAR
ncbi:MAG TPA: cation diffusion facilitator family transporter [Candidatus Dormibacteraeota bacterium]|nr:cation diffusion facilitator family transporter [Candidatus Dormibacteraeota bacterium]